MKMKIMDGNAAAAHVAYAFSEAIAVYPITPSSPMTEKIDEWSNGKRRNLFRQTVDLYPMQSEGGVAGALHGLLSAGTLSCAFTASQGLLLILPNMYKIAGELLPTVLHVSSRSIATHALNIFCDHSDVMACRQTGFAMLCSSSVQECMDLSLVAHLCSLRAGIPFIHFFDGFRTSHELSKIQAFDEENDYEEIRCIFHSLGMEKYATNFRKRALTPERPVCKGTTQNEDIFFQNKEAANPFYDDLFSVLEETMRFVSDYTKREYRPFDYYGAKDAEFLLVIMGSGGETAVETALYCNQKGKKYGVVKVRLYRPFDSASFVRTLPSSCKKIAVLDRTKESGAVGEPLYTDVCAALKKENVGHIFVCGGRYGLGGKDFNADMVVAVFKNLEEKQPKNNFTVGIRDDVSFRSLDYSARTTFNHDVLSCLFYGFGSDGTVGASKSTVSLVGEQTDLYVQAYFSYDSKKSGGFTLSQLRFSNAPVQSEYAVQTADFIACHKLSYLTRYDVISRLKEGGTYLLNCPYQTAEEVEKKLPPDFLSALQVKRARLFTIDGNGIAEKVGLKGKISAVMQAAFFYLHKDLLFSKNKNVSLSELLQKEAEKNFSKKGGAIVEKNKKAILLAKDNLHFIPLSNVSTKKKSRTNHEKTNDYFQTVATPILSQQGNELPVSAFSADGRVPTATTKYEKRGAAEYVPHWNGKRCIQCNQCAFSCPHACIRPFLFPDTTPLPNDFLSFKATQADGYLFRIQVSPLDCMGCGVCADVCPVNQKVRTPEKANEEKIDDLFALRMRPLEEEKSEDTLWSFALALPQASEGITQKMPLVKRVSFSQPLFEFSGACAGCGETPYLSTLARLFGDRLVIANATGCSSIYGGSAPTCPYATTKKGYGPSWANSLFEDNAEFGFGIAVGYKKRREEAKNLLRELADILPADSKEQAAAKDMLNVMQEQNATKQKEEEKKENLLSLLKKSPFHDRKDIKDRIERLVENQDALLKKSVWLVGGDGWAYDIGYGGLDHVLASGENVNILVLDTEVYSNTGGQISKATPMGAVAKFAVGGKKTKKKKLGLMALTYGNVYVAQCSMGADKGQLVKAFIEAESYDGVSLIVCYAPCIAHGIDMSRSQEEEKRAVDYGYWHLYRYNPELKKSGRPPFILDSKEPKGDIFDFLNGEARFALLQKTNPEQAKRLYEEAERTRKENFALLQNLANLPPRQF